MIILVKTLYIFYFKLKSDIIIVKKVLSFIIDHLYIKWISQNSKKSKI